MCKLYLITKSQAAILEFTRSTRDGTGALPRLMGVFPDSSAPVARTGDNGERELTMMRWGIPSLDGGLQSRMGDSCVSSVDDVTSPHWHRWLGPAHRCVVPFTSFSDYQTTAENKKVPVWFARDKSRPLMAFAGIWTNWTGIRKAKEGEVSADYFALMTEERETAVAPTYPTTRPAILTDPDDIDVWMRADWPEASALRRPLARDLLQRLEGWRSDKPKVIEG